MNNFLQGLSTVFYFFLLLPYPLLLGEIMSPYTRFDTIFSYVLKQEDNPLFAIILLIIFHFVTLVFFSMTKIRLFVQISLFVFTFYLFLKKLDGISLAFAFSRITGKCTFPVYCDLPFNVLKNADYWLYATTILFLTVAILKIRISV